MDSIFEALPVMSAEERAAFVAEARAVDAEIRSLARKRNRDKILIAQRLVLMNRRRLHAALGWSDLAAYARNALEYSFRNLRDAIGMAERLESLPLMRAAAEAGELYWTKVREASSVATPETEGVWLHRARTLSSRKLERLVKRALNEEPLVSRTLRSTEQQHATIEDAVLAMQQESGETLSYEEALARICQRAMTGGAKAVGGPRYRVVITVCAECGLATRETRDGTVPVDEASAQGALCDAEVLDIRDGPATLQRTMPPRIANLVDARDRGRCQFPGCDRRAFIHRHHEGGWRVVGHDPKRVLLLCDSHHRDRHEGHFTIEGGYPDFRFVLADGTPVVAPPADHDDDRCSRGHDETAAAPATTADSTTTGAPRPDALPEAEVRGAFSALRTMGLGGPEARAAMARALSRWTGAPLTVRELVRAALRVRAEGRVDESDLHARGGSPAPDGGAEARDVETALRRLGYGAREAKAAIRRALAAFAGSSPTTSDLLREALRKHTA